MKTEFLHGKRFESLFARVRGIRELELENGFCGLEKECDSLEDHCCCVGSGLKS